MAALPLLIDLFEARKKLAALEPFLSEHWADFYGYPYSQGEIMAVRESWTVPVECQVPGANDSIVPFWFNQKLKWRIVAP